MLFCSILVYLIYKKYMGLVICGYLVEGVGEKLAHPVKKNKTRSLPNIIKMTEENGGRVL